MTMFGPAASAGRSGTGEPVAGYSTYEAAQKAVSALIAADVPAREIAIIGRGLRSVERVTGRLGYATAARTGAVNGVLLGLLFSAVLVIGSPSVPIQAFVGVVFVGIAIGMLTAIVMYSLVRRRRDYASVMQVVAEQYEVTVAAAHVHRARAALGTTAPKQTVTTDADEPPKYGERLPAAARDAPAQSTGADPAAEPDGSAAPEATPGTGDPSGAQDAAGPDERR